MITLSSERGLIRVESWSEIEGRPGFKKDLNPTEHKLDSIIGRYVFAETIKCGLSNCHKPHAKGYIVVTKDGHETNIGKDCGKTYFGVDFETLTKRFDRDITQAENRERLWNFTFKIEELELRISNLRKEAKGADWVHRNIRPLVTPNTGCPETVVRQLARMVKNRSSVLSIQREATQSEIEDQEAIENRSIQRPYYVDQPIASINGIEAIYPENDLRALLALHVELKLKEFQGVQIDALTYGELRNWVKWVDSVDPTLEQVVASIEWGRKLLNSENLSPLLKITRGTEATLFRSYIDGLAF